MIEHQTLEPQANGLFVRHTGANRFNGFTHATSKIIANTGGLNTTPPSEQSITALLPIMGAVLFAFLVIGIALPVLPLHVHQGLGLSTFVVGLVTGSQFAASLISRVWSGHFADRRGSKRAVIVGLLTAVAAGLLYLFSLLFVATPWLSVSIAGRHTW